MGLSLQVLSETSSCLYISGTNHPSTDNMKIYKDVFSGDELFSDTYPMKLVDDCMYEVYGKNDYMAYLKDYMKNIVKYLEEHNRAGEVDTFKKNINGVMKGLLGKFSDLQFYQGESMNPAAMICLIEYREIEGEERPVIMFFKHGLEEEKV